MCERVVSPTGEDDELLIKDEMSSEDLFSEFVTESADLLEVISVFEHLCQSLDINHHNYKTIYQNLTARLSFWKAKNLWNKIEKKAKHVDYKNKPCSKLKAVIVGAGPCGLRTAIELALLGAEVILLEKRDSFSRNNVLHLWSFLIVDLKSLGAKIFYGKFCAGSLDHISIRKLQCILLKVCLILGVQVFPKTSFEELVEPAEGRGWRIKTSPSHKDIAGKDIDIVIGADGRRNVLKGFKRKEFRGKLAIGITVNFVNKNTKEEAAIEEISGVAFIYNQQFFQELKDKTGIDLENIVYYKDDTHYFVMTAKKRSLIEKGVIKHDNVDARQLLSPTNINQPALCEYAKQAVDFSTNYKLPHHEFAINHYGKEDVAMFDFTSMHAAENASRIVERKGKRLLMGIVGDTLIEPFWPTGSGCARGFLSALDAAWTARGFGLGKEPLDIIQERECILKLLAQTKPDNMMTNHQNYSIDPSTRYPVCNTKSTRKEAVRHLYDKSDDPFSSVDYDTKARKDVLSNKIKNQVETGTGIDAYSLLKWCQIQTKEYPGVKIFDMALSWKNGLGFCAIINRYRPDILNFFDLDEKDAEKNCQLAFDVAEEHLGIPPKTSGRDFTSAAIPDRLTVISYLSLYYDTFKGEIPDDFARCNGKRSIQGFWKPLRTFALVGTNAKEKLLWPDAESPRKSPIKANKMSIIARLSRKSKKKERNLQSRRAKEKRANKENMAQNVKGAHSKFVGKKKYAADEKTFLMQSDSETSLSPEHKSHEEPESPPEILQPIAQNRICKNEKDTSLEQKEDIENLRNGSKFAIIGGQIGESETDVVEDTQSKRRSKINMLAESVFGVSTKQAVAEAEASLSESEICWFCKRRVYVMERMSAEGKFFHRQCFRCAVCKCNLLLGNYVFDDDDERDKGVFYCKLHYNRIVYNKPEAQASQVASPRRTRRSRPSTQIIQPSSLKTAFSPSSDAESKMSATPLLNIPTESETNEPDEVSEQKGSPYEKFEAKTLVRHPSLTRQQSKKLSPVKGSQFGGDLKHAASSPALQKILKEDNEFGEDLRRRSELKDDGVERKRHLRKLSPSIQLRKSVEKDLSSREVIVPGQPSSPLKIKKKLELGNDLPSYKSHSASFVPVSVDIELGDESYRVDDEKDLIKREKSEVKRSEIGKQKKKKYVLKKKKAKKTTEPIILEDDKENITIAERRTVEVTKETDTNILTKNDQKEDIKAEMEEKMETVGLTMQIKKTEDRQLETKKVAHQVADSYQKEDKMRPTFVASKEGTRKEKDGKKSILTEKVKSKKKSEKKKERKEKEGKNKIEDEDSDWVVVNLKDELEIGHKVDGMSDKRDTSDDSEASDAEELKAKSKDGFFSSVFGAKPKRVLKTAEQVEEEEEKRKRKLAKQIQQAQNERKLKRLWEAQSIQRKLNEVEVRQLEIDERAKNLERKLRMPYLKPEEEGRLMLDWFQVVNDKNVLLRFESELVIQANNIQLEDRQARLENDIRALLTSDHPKDDDQEWIEVLTKELVDTVEERNNLVEMLEEDRLREMEEDKNLHDLMGKKAEELGMDRLI